jgi:hypothetical protein
MKKLMGTVLLAGALLATSAFGATPRESGFYLGAALGSTEFDDDGVFAGLGFDDSDTSIIAFGGYKFFRHFALEARYGDLGTYSVSPDITTERVSIDVWTVNAIGLVPFADGWEFYGQLGLGRVSFDCDGCRSEDAGSAGLGIRYFFNPQIAVGFQVDAYTWEEGPFDFGVGTAQLILKYLF